MAWASGMRLYAVLFSAGLLGRLGYLHLPTTLQVLENPLVMVISGFLLIVEFLADKIPAVDSTWDTVHTFIRIPAGAMLAALALGDHDPALMIAAGLLGGTLTAATHATKAGGRALINTSPEPFSNIATSFGEDALVASGLFAAYQYPVAFLAALFIFVLMLVWLLPKLVRALRYFFGRPLREKAADQASTIR
jgi:hypothetical protein